GYLRDADLDPKVTARNHDCVGRRDDRVEVANRLGLLDLGDYLRARAGGLNPLAQLQHVLGRLNEGERDVVDAVGERELEVDEVLGCQGRNGEGGSREVHALPRGDQAADLDPAGDTLALDPDDARPDPSVVDE